MTIRDFILKTVDSYMDLKINAYQNNKIGQGRENAKLFLKDNPEICAEIDRKVREHYNLGGIPSEMDDKKNKKSASKTAE